MRQTVLSKKADDIKFQTMQDKSLTNFDNDSQYSKDESKKSVEQFQPTVEEVAEAEKPKAVLNDDIKLFLPEHDKSMDIDSVRSQKKMLEVN